MGKSKKRNEDEIFEDILTANSNAEISAVKKEIETLIPKNIRIKAKNDNQIKLINSIRNNQITIAAGPPGTGKTFVSVAYALSLLRKQENRFKNIYLVKSVTTLKNEEVGYLKGGLQEKIEPVMWSFLINMEKLITAKNIDTLMDKEIIRPVPLAYVRGASLDNCIIIADEMQNVSLDNSRTLLTRIGSDCKLILLGDVNQIDIRNKKESSLEKLLDIFNDTEDFGVINMDLNDAENVRNPLITTIENKYNEYYESNGK